MHQEGKIGAVNHQKAVEFYTKAAGLNYPPAIHLLACAYFKGEGVEQNYAKALELYEKAADLCFVPSIQFMSLMYLHGRGVPKNTKLAESLSQRARKIEETPIDL
jgi:TPR repeat protein